MHGHIYQPSSQSGIVAYAAESSLTRSKTLNAEVGEIIGWDTGALYNVNQQSPTPEKRRTNPTNFSPSLSEVDNPLEGGAGVAEYPAPPPPDFTPAWPLARKSAIVVFAGCLSSSS